MSNEGMDKTIYTSGSYDGSSRDLLCKGNDSSIMGQAFTTTIDTTTVSNTRKLFHLITPRSSSILEDAHLPIAKDRLTIFTTNNEDASSVSSEDEDEPRALVEFVKGTNETLRAADSLQKRHDLVHILQRLFLFIATLWLLNHHHRILPFAKQLSAPKDSVCVAGGGFSGFWFTLGRLRSIPDPYSKEYYCFSAGCLATVATLRGFSMEYLYDMASRIQRQWRTGEISRYAVVSSFVDQLLLHDQTTEPTTIDASSSSNRNNTTTPTFLMDRPDLLTRLHIETTVKAGRWGVTTSIRTPQNMEQLRIMLIQTAFIPLATGNDLWLHDHMDGAFSIPHHPACEHYVGLSVGWDLLDLLWNVVNVNLSRDKVEKFWNMGLEYGL